MGKSQIIELQDCFEGRSKINKAVMAIKCYANANDASLFFSYTDSWKNKKYINIPIEPEELLPLLEKQIESIDTAILNIAREQSTKSVNFNIVIINEVELLKFIEDYKSRYPSTYTSLETLKENLNQTFHLRLNDGGKEVELYEDYHIEVCSDWQDKIYVLEFQGENNGDVQFLFKEIYKL